MPITANDLRAGDILFKHAEKKLIPKIIKWKQKKILKQLTGGRATRTDKFAISRTHVAMAAGPRDVLEFDEGGNGAKIVFRSGFGFVRGDMTAGARKGNAYDVYSCVDTPLGRRAADNASVVWDITKGRGSRVVGQYGFKKLVRQIPMNAHRGRRHTRASFEERLQKWLDQAARGGKIKFFCSEFVTYCYLWAAAQSNQFASVDQLFRTSQSKISPVELYWRVDTCSKFRFKGTLYS